MKLAVTLLFATVIQVARGEFQAEAQSRSFGRRLLDTTPTIPLTCTYASAGKSITCQTDQGSLPFCCVKLTSGGTSCVAQPAYAFTPCSNSYPTPSCCSKGQSNTTPSTPSTPNTPAVNNAGCDAACQKISQQNLAAQIQQSNTAQSIQNTNNNILNYQAIFGGTPPNLLTTG